MRARIAVATVSGKTYYLVVNELKRKNVPFVSLKPDEPIPVEVKVVITSAEEKRLIDHETVLTLEANSDPAAVVDRAIQFAEGKGVFEKVVIGVDPGEIFGLAVLAGGKILETENCYSVQDVLNRIETVVRRYESAQVPRICVRIGDGVPVYSKQLLHSLDKTLPARVILESVGEAGTDSRLMEAKHRRGLRDIVSAIQIAGREGHVFQRRDTDESHG